MMANSERRTTKIRRRRGACLICKERKLRCCGSRPCGNCAKSDVDCEYPVSSHRAQSQQHEQETPRSSNKQIRYALLHKPDNNSRLQLHADQVSQRDSGSTTITSEHCLRQLRTPGSIDSAVGDSDFGFRPASRFRCNERQEERHMSLAKIYSSRRKRVRIRPPSTIRILDSFGEELSSHSTFSSQVTPDLKAMLFKVNSLLNTFEDFEVSQSLQMNCIDAQKNKSYMRSFFENSHLGSTYISEQKIQRLADQMIFNTSSLQGADKALLYTTLAVGCELSSTLGHHAEARAYYGVAADLIWNIIAGPLDITKLQALTTMVGTLSDRVYALDVLTWQILFTLCSSKKENIFFLVSNAVSTIQTFGLCFEVEIEKISSNAKDQFCIKRLVWIVASIEGFLGLRYGFIPTLTHDIIDFASPKGPLGIDEDAAENEQLYFTAFCELGHICSLICQTRTDSSKDDISQLQSLLNTWKSSLSSELQKQDELQIWVHEAIFGLELMSFTSRSAYENILFGSMLEFLTGSDLALSSARDMLRSLILSAQMKETSHLVRLMVISWCIVFSAIVHGRGEKDDLALISLGSALFARLSHSRSVDCGFHEVSQLGGAAASMLLTQPSSNKGVVKRRGKIESATSRGEDGPETFGPRSCRPSSIDQQQSVSNSQNSFAPASSMPPYTAITAPQSSVLDSWPSDVTVDELLQIDTVFDPSWESQWETANLMLQELGENVNQRPDEANSSDMNMVC